MAIDLEKMPKLGFGLMRLPQKDGEIDFGAVCEMAEKDGVKSGLYLWPLRTSLSGRPVSPGGATELAEILGYDETMRRIDKGIEKLS